MSNKISLAENILSVKISLAQNILSVKESVNEINNRVKIKLFFKIMIKYN